MVSMKPVPRPLSRSFRTFGGIRGSDLVRGDATVTVRIEPKDERVGLVDELPARDLAILILVEIAEIRVSQHRVGPLDRRKLGGIEMPVAVAVG
jgi:hypothetical protein